MLWFSFFSLLCWRTLETVMAWICETKCVYWFSWNLNWQLQINDSLKSWGVFTSVGKFFIVETNYWFWQTRRKVFVTGAHPASWKQFTKRLQVFPTDLQTRDSLTLTNIFPSAAQHVWDHAGGPVTSSPKDFDEPDETPEVLRTLERVISLPSDAAVNCHSNFGWTVPLSLRRKTLWL